MYTYISLVSTWYVQVYVPVQLLQFSFCADAPLVQKLYNQPPLDAYTNINPLRNGQMSV